MAIAMTLFMVGCGETSGDTSYTTVTNTTVDCSEGKCGDIYLTQGDNNVFTGTGEHNGTSGESVEDFDMALYDENFTQQECNDLGFFYCGIEDKCLPQRKAEGTCTANL